MAIAENANLNQITLSVSKTVTKNGKAERELVGSLPMYVPTLRDIGIDADPTDQKEEGELVYANNVHQFIYNALATQAKAIARNRLKPGTTQLRGTTPIATTLEELATPAENTSNVLAERRGLMELFKGHIGQTNLAAPLQKLLQTFLEKPEVLVMQPAEKRQKIKTYFETFGNAVEDQLTEWQGNYLVNVIEQCDAAEVEF